MIVLVSVFHIRQKFYLLEMGDCCVGRKRFKSGDGGFVCGYGFVAALEQRGAGRKSVTVLNDTTATLLAGVQRVGLSVRSSLAVF